MKDISPYTHRREVLLEPEDIVPTVPVSSWHPVAEGANTASLWDYWSVIKKRAMTIAACLCAAISLAVAVFLVTTPTYTAKTTLLIERKEPQVVDVKNVLPESSDAQDDYYKTQYELLKSRSLAAQTIREQGYEKSVVLTGTGGDKFAFLRKLRQLPGTLFAWLNSFFCCACSVRQERKSARY